MGLACCLAVAGLNLLCFPSLLVYNLAFKVHFGADVCKDKKIAEQMRLSNHIRRLSAVLFVPIVLFASFCLADQPSAKSSFHVDLPAQRSAADLVSESPFGINTAFRPGAANLAAVLQKMQEAGIKWGRQDFTWRRIEKGKGRYDWDDYDRLVEMCHEHGILLFGNLAYAPNFHDPTTAEGVQAYCDFVSATVKHFAGRVNYWQIWNEPNGGFWKGTPQQYAQLLAAAGEAIHQANPNAKVLGLNMAFCDILWAEKILSWFHTIVLTSRVFIPTVCRPLRKSVSTGGSWTSMSRAGTVRS